MKHSRFRCIMETHHCGVKVCGIKVWIMDPYYRKASESESVPNQHRTVLVQFCRTGVPNDHMLHPLYAEVELAVDIVVFSSPQE